MSKLLIEVNLEGGTKFEQSKKALQCIVSNLAISLHWVLVFVADDIN